MRRIFSFFFVILLVAAPLAARDRKPKPPPVDPELLKVVAPLIDQLDAASFETREAASLELMRMGPTTRPALLPAMEHSSMEVRMRVRRVLLHYTEMNRLETVGRPVEGDWPMLKRGPGRGASSGATAIRQEPELIWHRVLPRPTGLPYFDSPMLATKDKLFIVNRYGDVVSVKRETGEIDWLESTGEPVFAGPVLVGDTIYVPGTSLTAMDSGTGRIRWKYPTDYGVIASPLVHAGAVFAVEKGEKLVSIDPANGEENWKVRLDATASAPVVVGELVILGTAEGVQAFRSSDGSRRWTYKTPAPVTTSPAILPDRIVVGDSARGIFAITADKGREIWRRKIPDGRLIETPVVYGDNVLFSTVGATFRALRASDGADRWTRFVGSRFQSSPCVMGGLVYFTAGASIHAVECADGDDAWRMSLIGAFSSPILMDGTLYVVTLDGVLLAFR